VPPEYIPVSFRRFQYIVGTSEWSVEEQSIMDRVLAGLNEEHFSSLHRCVAVAAQLPEKNAREVAARLRSLRVSFFFLFIF
jgi:hypothetical protein